MNKKVFGFITLSLMIMLMLGTVTVSPDKLSVNTGSKVSVSISGLTDGEEYVIYDEYDNVIEVFDSEGTSHTSKVTILNEGKNTFDLCFYDNDTLITSFTIVGVDAFEGIYVIVPYLFAIGVVLAVLGFATKITSKRR